MKQILQMVKQKAKQSSTSKPQPASTRKRLIQDKLVAFARTGKGKPLMGTGRTAYGGFGEKIADKHQGSDKAFKNNYRMAQMLYQENAGGAGLDEMVSTATVAKIVNELMKKKKSKQVINRAVGKLSREREEVKNLMWTTGNPKAPLAGHPGALSKKRTDNRKGITKSHNTYDSIRAKWVKNQYDKSAQSESQLEETSIMGQIMTNQLLSQPYAQLQHATLSKNAEKAYHPRHGKLYKNGTGTKGLKKALADVHNARERRKWEIGQRLIDSGKEELVDPEMVNLIKEHGGYANAQFQFNQTNRSSSDTGSAHSEAYIPTKGEQPVTLNEWEQQVKTGGRKRAISAPRPYIMPGLGQASDHADKSKQTTLFDFFSK